VNSHHQLSPRADCDQEDSQDTLPSWPTYCAASITMADGNVQNCSDPLTGKKIFCSTCGTKVPHHRYSPKLRPAVLSAPLRCTTAVPPPTALPPCSLTQVPEPEQPVAEAELTAQHHIRSVVLEDRTQGNNHGIQVSHSPPPLGTHQWQVLRGSSTLRRSRAHTPAARWYTHVCSRRAPAPWF
jgi:hypothetical protein